MGIVVSGSDLFVVNGHLTPNGPGSIGEYTTEGATVNGDLVSGLTWPEGIAICGSDLFVTEWDSGAIGEYTTSGAIVNADLVSAYAGNEALTDIAISRSDLFVTTNGPGTVDEYTTDGATVNADLISGLDFAEFLAISGSDLFVVNEGTGTIGEYTTSGATVNADLVSGLDYPVGIAVESVPEPTTMSLVSLAVLGMLARRLRRSLAPGLATGQTVPDRRL
jgi:hypothetical protein